jgi:RHS repeat-associated protein
MLMPERSSNSYSYRYGFQGYEGDSEIKGEGNSYTTEFRQYDPRLGRWLTLDPLMASFPWQSPYVAFDNNPIYYRDPLGAASEGSGNPPESEDPPPGKWMPEVTVHAPKNVATITLTEHKQEPGFWKTIGNWFRSVDNKLMGTSTWTFGIEFKTRDGKSNGNTANPVKLKDADNVITLYWDDIEDLTTSLKAISKELPKEFRESPGYSGPGQFIDEAKKWIGPQEGKPSKQMDGKNWSPKENRSEKTVLEKPTAKQISQKVQLRIQVNQGGNSIEIESQNFPNEKKLTKEHPDATKQNGEWWLNINK